LEKCAIQAAPLSLGSPLREPGNLLQLSCSAHPLPLLILLLLLSALGGGKAAAADLVVVVRGSS